MLHFAAAVVCFCCCSVAVAFFVASFSLAWQIFISICALRFSFPFLLVFFFFAFFWCSLTVEKSRPGKSRSRTRTAALLFLGVRKRQKDIIKRGCQRYRRQCWTKASAKCTRQQQQQDSRAKQIGLRAELFLLLLLQALYGKLFGKLNIKTMCTYATLMQFWPSKRAESRRGKNARHQIRELRGHTPRILNFCVCAAAQFRLRRGYCGFVRI